MKFLNRVEDLTFYNRLRDYAYSVLYNLNKLIDINEKEEIFSWAIEQSSIKNLEISDEETFIRGYFKNEIKWRWLNINKKPKFFEEFTFENDKESEDYEEIITEDEKTLNKNIKALKKNEDLYQIFEDKYYKSLNISQLITKYGLKKRAMEKKITTINKILKGTTVVREYKGICRINGNGDIDKFYESATATEKDGFDRSCVTKVVNKNGGYHKGFYFKFLKDTTTTKVKINES